MKKRVGILGILIAILILGIGYAAISDIVLKVNGTGSITATDANFDVKFTGTPTTSGDGTISATIESDLQARLTVTGLTKKDDEATAVYTILNNSPELTANLVASLEENTNSTYFDVTYTLGASSIAAGNTTTLTVKVKAKETPITDQTTTLEVDVTASAVEA